MSNNYGAGNDGCEEGSLKHWNSAQARVIVGAGARRRRLCEECSRLPKFARLRKRVPIEPRDCPHPSRQPHGNHEWYTGGGIHPGTSSDKYCRACGAVKPIRGDERKEGE